MLVFSFVSTRHFLTPTPTELLKLRINKNNDKMIRRCFIYALIYTNLLYPKKKAAIYIDSQPNHHNNHFHQYLKRQPIVTFTSPPESKQTAKAASFRRIRPSLCLLLNAITIRYYFIGKVRGEIVDRRGVIRTSDKRTERSRIATTHSHKSGCRLWRC